MQVGLIHATDVLWQLTFIVLMDVKVTCGFFLMYHKVYSESCKYEVCDKVDKNTLQWIFSRIFVQESLSWLSWEGSFVLEGCWGATPASFSIIAGTFQ